MGRGNDFLDKTQKMDLPKRKPYALQKTLLIKF